MKQTQKMVIQDDFLSEKDKGYLSDLVVDFLIEKGYALEDLSIAYQITVEVSQ